MAKKGFFPNFTLSGGPNHSRTIRRSIADGIMDAQFIEEPGCMLRSCTGLTFRRGATRCHQTQVVKAVIQHAAANRTEISGVCDTNQYNGQCKRSLRKRNVLTFSHGLLTLLVQKRRNPPRIARLVEKEEKTAVFTVGHHQRSFSKVVLLTEMQNQPFKVFLIITMDADRLTVPVNPNRHANTINRCGVVGSG